MLEDLKIINGILSPEFDVYNNIYSVDVDEDVTELVMEYQVSDGYYVNVIDNKDFSEGENQVYIQVIKDTDVSTYTLLVYKEKSEAVFNYEELLQTIEVKEEVPSYIAPLIAGSCIILILILFLLLFRRKKGKSR